MTDDWAAAIAKAVVGLEAAGVRFVLVVEGKGGSGAVLSNVASTVRSLEGAVELIEAGDGAAAIGETRQ